MRITIRSKLIVAISALVIVLFATASYLFIKEKKVEFSEDIYVNALAFSRLTAPNIAYNYELYLTQNSFVYFNREIKSIFEQNDDVAEVDIVSYNGEILYDSDEDKDKQYFGEPRTIEDSSLIEQIRSENISVRTKDGDRIFLKFQLDEGFDYVDKDEKIVESLKVGTLIDYLVIPANEKYSVIYKLDYHNLDERVERIVERIIYLALFGVMLGIILSFVMSAQVAGPVGLLVTGAEEIAKGNFKIRVDIKTRDEMNFLGQAFNKMAQDLESSIEAKLYRERVTRELELAADIQDQIVPDQEEIPQVDGLKISAGLIPAEEIGGDIYDFLPLDDKRLLMYLGDVTGHGVPAGIVSSIASALFYGYSTEADLKKILIEVNRVMKVKTMPTMFLTLCLMQWDSLNKKFSYVSAGHEQMIHYHADTKKAQLKPAGGIAVGMLPDISKMISVAEIDLKIGDFLVIYSDGIPEMWRNDEEIYGVERLRAFIEKLGSVESPSAMQEAILADVKAFAAGYKQMDDVTIMVIKRV